jgi:acyl carrier protein
MASKVVPPHAGNSVPVGPESHVSLRDLILDEIRRVAQEHKKTLGPLEDSAPLLSTGLDSLCFAVLVVRLEETLKVDPFSGDDEVEFPTALGELIRIYESAKSKI